MSEPVDSERALARSRRGPGGAITSQLHSTGGTPSCDPLVQGACQSAKCIYLMDLVYLVEPQVDRKPTESRRNYAIHTFLGLRFYTAVELGFSPRFSGKAAW